MRKTIQTPMSRQGQLEIAAIIVILIAPTGAVAVFSQSSHIYVGDKSLQMFYDYKFCPENVKKIKEGNQVIFNSVNEAKDSGYNPARGCIEGVK